MQLWSLATRPCTFVLFVLFVFRKPASSTPASAGVAFTGDCWDQWNEFWTANQSVSFSTKWSTSTATEVSTFITTRVDYATYNTQNTTVETESWTHYEVLGGNTVGTGELEYLTATDVYSGPAYSPTSTESPQTVIKTVYVTHTYQTPYTITSALPKPTCVLPSLVPQCQSQWDRYIAGAQSDAYLPMPLCSQATINSAQCESVISEFYSPEIIFGYTGIPAWITSGSSTFWPTSRTYAPGCTLGCQSCAITGKTVQLFYWPPHTASAVENGTLTARPSALPPNSDSVVVAVINDTTLTSPTVYISYDTLYASNSCSGIGRTFKNTIIPIPMSSDLSSLAYDALSNIATGPGMWQELSWKYVTRPFNFSDLIEPIPQSIYDQMPVCQQELRSGVPAGTEVSDLTTSCVHNGPYAPIIAIPTEVSDLDPSWKSCTMWYGGLFDPPIALHGRTAETTPASTSADPTTRAQPSSTAGDGLPKETGVSVGAIMTDPNSRPSARIGSSRAQSSNPVSFPSQSSDPHVTERLPKSAGDPAGTSLIANRVGDESARTNALTILSEAEESFIVTETRTIETSSYPAAASGGFASVRASSGFGSAAVQATVTLGGATYTMLKQASEDSILIDSTVYSPGQTGTIHGTPFSVGTAGIAIGTTSVGFSAARTSATPTGKVPVAKFTAGGSTETVKFELGRLEVDGSTLTPGEVTLINHKTVSVGSSSILVDGTTVPVSDAVSAIAKATHAAAQASAAILTLGGQIVTASELSGDPRKAAVGSVTLSDGGPARTIDGQVITEIVGGLVVDGGTTVPLNGIITAKSRTYYAEAPSATPSSGAGAFGTKPQSYFIHMLLISLMCI